MRERIFVGLGANEGACRETIFAARQEIEGLLGVEGRAFSSLYSTEPQGYRNQSWFTNAVMELSLASHWKPEQFLEELLRIEARLGRVRTGPRFGARRIDLDLLVFGERIVATAHCQLPHPRLTQRAFVLIPWLEIAPDYLFFGTPLRSYLERLHYRKEGLCIYQEDCAEGLDMSLQASTKESNIC